MASKENKKRGGSSGCEPEWCALQHIKFKEAVEEWRSTKKGGRVRIVREENEARTRNETSTKKKSWKRMHDSHYDAYYWFNETTGESRWECMRGEIP